MSRKMGGGKESIAGARASHAGNEFHFRYAARRALRLLNERSGPTFIRIERAESPSSGSAGFLGIDSCEYYGGDSITTANRVLAFQFKYSVTDPQKPWTAARLCQKSSDVSTSSVIGRAGGDLADFIALSSPEVVRSKLSWTLVSNQPVDSGLLATIGDVQAGLGADANTDLESFVSQLEASRATTIKKLRAASGLNWTEFALLIEVLDLSKCGEASLEEQEALFHKEAGSDLVGDFGKGFGNLLSAIRRLALPDKAEHEGLARNDLLACFGLVRTEELLPAPPRLQAVQNPIPTTDVSRLLAQIAEGHQTILAHGPAGIGKTTTLQLLETALPTGSVVLIFDCFGGGSYMDFGAVRHTANIALRQIHNELATKFGLPLLVSMPQSLEALEIAVQIQIAAAAKLAHAQGGILVCAIDAADNAVAAAIQRSERCFVTDLLRFKPPEHCCLLLTCRTHRASTLGDLTGFTMLNLSGFDIDGSTRHLLRRFPSATYAHCLDFHHLTNGVPRLQAYRLGIEGGAKPDSVDDVLASGQTSLSEVFENILQQLNPVPVSQQQVARFLCLQRPILMGDAAPMLSLSSSDASLFFQSLVPGVVIEEGQVLIRDEDFERFLWDRTSKNDLVKAHQFFAEALLAAGMISPYDCRVLPEHLAAAGLTSKLVELAVSGQGLDLILDLTLRRQVELRRIQLGLAACLKGQHRVEAVKLLFSAAMASKVDFALQEVIQANPQLATKYIESEAVLAYTRRQDSEPWLGSLHLQLAAMKARELVSRPQAEEHLDKARAWTGLYFAKRKEQGFQWRFEPIHLSFWAEAHFYLRGLGSSIDFLNGWRPKEFTAEALQLCMDRLIRRNGAAMLAQQVENVKLSSRQAYIVARCLTRADQALPPSIRAGALRALRSSAVPASDDFSRRPEFPIDVCEGLFASGLATKTLESVLTCELPSVSDDIGSDYPRGDFDVALRAASMMACIHGSSLIPESLFRKRELDEKPQQNSYDLDRSRSFLTSLIPFYVARANVLIKGCPFDLSVVAPLLASRPAQTYKYKAFAGHLLKMVLRHDPVSTDLIEQIFDRTSSNYGLKIELIGILIDSSRPKWAMCRIESLWRELIDAVMPSREKREALLNLADLADIVDSSLGRDIFASAVDIAEGPDEDSAALLRALASSIEDSAARPFVIGNRANLSARLDRSLKLIRPYLSEDKYLPDDAVMSAVASIWPAGALSLCHRWDEHSFESIRTSFRSVLLSLAKHQKIGLCRAVSLLRLCGDRHDHSYLGLRIVNFYRDDNERCQAVRMLSDYAMRDTDDGNQKEAVSRVAAWISEFLPDRRSTFEDIFVANELENSRSTINRMDQATSSAEWESNYDKERRMRLHAGIALVRSGQPDQIVAGTVTVLDAHVNRADLETLAEELIARTSYSDRASILTKVVSHDLGYGGSESLAQLLILVLKDWRPPGGTAGWIDDVIGAFLRRHALHLPFYYERADELLTALLELSSPTLDAGGVLAEQIAESLPSIGLLQSVSAAKVSLARLSDEDYAGATSWFLDQFDEHLGVSDLALEEIEAPENLEEAWARFLWTTLGHADSAYRWGAMHHVLDRFLEDAEVREELIQLLDTRSEGAFCEDQRLWFWMTAHVSLLTVLELASCQHQDVLQAHHGRFLSIALSRGLPHAQIRELAKRICLYISPQESEALFLANRPSCSHVKRGQEYVDKYQVTRPPTKFSFGLLDDVAILFDPITKAFGAVSPEVVSRADRWISEVWKFTEDDCKRRPPSQEYDDYLRYDLRDGEPEVFCLQTYLEWHAACCVAGELVDSSVCQVVDDYDEPDDPWDDIIRSWIPSRPGSWVGQFRDPKPLEAPIWNAPPSDSTWVDSKKEDDYWSALGCKAGFGRIVVCSGDYNRYSYAASEWVRIASGLVDEGLGKSLAISLADDKRLIFSFHSLWEDDPPRASKSGHGFSVIRLTERVEIPDGLDQQDPDARKGMHSFDAVTPDCCEWLGCSYDGQHKTAATPEGVIVCRTERWDNLSRPVRGEQHGACGERTWIATPKLFELLRSFRKELVVTVDISRNEKNSKERRRRDNGTRRAYIIRGNETIEDVRSGQVIGTLDCQGTQS